MRKLNNASAYLPLFFISIIFSSCQAIGDIFKTGVGVGIAIVVIIIIIILFVMSKFKKDS